MITEKDITSWVGDELLKNNLNKNMTTIKWYQSKTVWFNVLMTIIGVTTLLQSVATFDKYAQALVLISAVGNVILRVWFTSTNIASQ